ncbi:preprotein translocase subunit SecA [Candidatus Beckwithbacteria bacterium]|nr:preprotein translocase subunit SecA [Candidatus Beckwithbacteria bacterium]
MVLSWLKSLTDENKKILKRYEPMVAKINELESEMQKLKKDEFTAYTAEFKLRLEKGETLDDVLPEAYALAREAGVRVLGMRMFDVQLMAALAFHFGQVAEQKTGEGKTLSAVPALYLNSLTGKGCHLVTVNDYLARRDAGWMAQIFALLGVSVGVIYSGKGEQPALIYDPEFTDSNQHDERLRHLRLVSRQEAYGADITYGTNNEFGFDYLRDNMVQSLREMVQRGHHFAIVDEVDSILIDEARTPLIISAPDTDPTDKYYRFAELIKDLSADTDYTIDEKFKSAALTEHGITKVEKKLGIDNLYEKDFEVIHHIENALKARTLYLKDRDYVVKEDQIIIVDEFTGRLMYGRRWSEGLHQAVEAKENVKIQQESKTLATISFQNYFRMYEKLSGMTGTAATEAEEFRKIYNLEVLVVPTNRSVARIDSADMVYKTTRAKYAAITDEIANLHAKGQPVLVGTTSISKNEIVSNFLRRKKIPHNVLNAKNHEKEAMIIADAGKVGAVTIATNIAGRGVDIVLGGAKPDEVNFKTKKAYEKELDQWKEEHEKVIELGGLFVLGTERHESRRIDNQLRGRSGRQGDPGQSRFYVALDDDIMRLFGGDKIAGLMTMFKLPEDVPLEHGMVSRAIEQAQTKVEGFHFDSRKHVVEYDDVMNKQREIIYKRRQQILEMAASIEKESSVLEKDEVQTNLSLQKRITDNINADITNLVAMYAPEGFEDIEYEQMVREFSQIVPFDLDSQKRIQQELEKLKNKDKVTEKLTEIFESAYKGREQELGSELMRQIETFISLRTIDKLWMEHLTAIDDLREGIGLRGYGQRDPLVEYKNEAFGMFERLLANIDFEIGRQVLRVGVARPQTMPTQVVTQHPEAETPGQDTTSSPAQSEVNSSPVQNPPIASQSGRTGTIKKVKKMGRNDPCWCGSGKKWKKCHYPEIG